MVQIIISRRGSNPLFLFSKTCYTKIKVRDMKCPNCKSEYQDNLFSCPNCGAINKEIYKDIKEVDLKKSSYESFKDDVRNNKFSLKKELPILTISIILILLAYFLGYYYFTYIENYPFLFKTIKYPLWLILSIPIALFLYYKNFSLLSLILNLYFSIFVGVSILFPFFLPLALASNGPIVYLTLALFPVIILISFAILKFTITKVKRKLLNHHITSYLIFMISSFYLLVTMITIIIRVTYY